MSVKILQKNNLVGKLTRAFRHRNGMLPFAVFREYGDKAL